MSRMLLCCLAVVAIASATVSAAPSQDESFESLLTTAEARFAAREYAEALDLARRASDLADTEDRQRKAERFAVLCLAMGGDPDADEAAADLLERFPSLRDDAELQVVLGTFYGQRGDHQKAYDTYGRAGKLLEDAGQDSDAWQAYIAQAELIRRFYDVIPDGHGPEARAWSPAEKERHAVEDAVRIYEHALTLDVGDSRRAQSLYRAGRTLAELGRWEFAERGIEFYRRCVAEYPDTTAAADAQYETGQAYRKFQRYVDAAREMGEFLRRYPRHRLVPAVERMMRDITEPQLSLWSAGPVCSGERPLVYWRSRNVEQMHLRAWPVELSEAVSDSEWFSARPSFRDVTSGEPAAQWTLAIDDDGEHRWHVCSPDDDNGDLKPIEVPLDSPGAYYISATADDGQTDTACVVIVSDMITVAKSDADEMLVFSVIGDVPADSVEVSTERLLYGRARTVRDRARTDKHGLARSEPLTQGRRARQWLATVSDGEHQSLCISDEHYWRPWGWTYPWRVYGFTDRGVYRPGQTVRYKQLIRAVSDDEYHNRPGTEVLVEVRDPLGEPVFTHRHETDAFGTIAGEMPLDASLSPGNYCIDLTIGQLRVPFSDAGASVFRVLGDSNSATWLEIRAERDTVRFGQQMRFLVSARTADGSPLDGADLRLVIRQEPFSATGTDSAEQPRPAVSAGLIRTNQDGQALVTVTAEGFPESPRMGAAYTVTVEHEGSAARAETRAMSQPIALDVVPEAIFCGTGDRINAAIIAADAFGRDVGAEDVTVTMSPADGGDAIARQALVIEDDTRAVISFEARRQGRYVVRAEARGAISAESEVFVAPAEDEPLASPPEGLTVIPSLRTCRIGQTLGVLVAAPFDEGPVLLTGEADELLFAEVVQVRGGWASMEVSVEESMSPNFTVVATAIRNGEVLSGDAEVTVPPTHRMLDIRADLVASNGTDTLRLKLSDRLTGKPVRGQLTVSLLSGEPGVTRPSAEQAFHGFTRDVQVRTFDSSDGLGKLTPRPAASDVPRRRTDRVSRGPASVTVQQPVRLDGISPARTLFWSAGVETNAEGLAELPVDLSGTAGPLTLWVMGTDRGQRVGSTFVRLPR